MTAKRTNLRKRLIHRQVTQLRELKQEKNADNLQKQAATGLLYIKVMCYNKNGEGQTLSNIGFLCMTGKLTQELATPLYLLYNIRAARATHLAAFLFVL